MDLPSSDVSALARPYQWVGPLPQGRISGCMTPIFIELLEALDGLLSHHGDAMLDIVDVRTIENRLRICHRLSRGKEGSDDLHASVERAIRAAEARQPDAIVSPAVTTAARPQRRGT